MHTPYLVPISVKGIVFEGDKVWLRQNERNEWELPGGKMDEGEQPEQTVIREMQEELGLDTEVVDIINHICTLLKDPKMNLEVCLLFPICVRS